MSADVQSADTPIPLPSATLRFRVAGDDDPNHFRTSGERSLTDLRRALGAIGATFDDFSTVLEWGCGCGRILRHIPRRDGQQLHGFDIDEEALAFLNEAMPWIRTSHTAGLPPMPHATETFDLIFNHSVMTHLDEDYQDAWLAELERTLKPGGILVLTVHGNHAFQANANSLQSKIELVRRGFLFTRTEHWKGQFPDFYHNAFHDVTYVFDHWGRRFDIRCYIPRGSLDYQDMIVLQRRTTADTAAKLDLRELVFAGDTLAFTGLARSKKRKLGWRLLREGLGLRRSKL